MTSLRNNIGAEPSTMSDRLLAAARESIVAVGWKRTTLTDVAGRAGVSRMTVYRTYPDMATLLADLMTREWTGLVAQVADAVEPAHEWPGRIASAVAGTVAALRVNALFRRMMDVDPEWMLPYLIDRRGRSQDAVLDALGEQIAQAQTAGGVRAGDPVLLARSVLLAAHGFAISGHTMADADVSLTTLDDELTDLVRRYLAS